MGSEDVYKRQTDAKLGRLGLTVLDDDLGFFPKYDAVVLMRADVDVAPLARLAGSIDAATMIAMNGEVELDGRSFAETAKKFLAGGFASASPRQPAQAQASLVERIFAPDFARLAGQHLVLVLASLALALGVGVPLGVAASIDPARRASGVASTSARISTTASYFGKTPRSSSSTVRPSRPSLASVE